jgi:protein SCO1/2
MRNLSGLLPKLVSVSRKNVSTLVVTRLILVPTILVALSLSLSACSYRAKKLPVIYSFQGLHTTFVNEDSAKVDFPQRYAGSIFVMSFIYTHCPYVCPMTTQNLHLLQDSLADLQIKGVKFVSLTYDPDRDTPPVLKKYAMSRGINLSDWDFLTGSKTNIDSVLDRVKIKYNFVDSSFVKGKLVYFVHHPDECALVDGKGRIRGLYVGSKLNFADIISDIKTLVK